jgi:hypothetical protein
VAVVRGGWGLHCHRVDVKRAKLLTKLLRSFSQTFGRNICRWSFPGGVRCSGFVFPTARSRLDTSGSFIGVLGSLRRLSHENLTTSRDIALAREEEPDRAISGASSSW